MHHAVKQKSFEVILSGAQILLEEHLETSVGQPKAVVVKMIDDRLKFFQPASETS
jgi:hypothetical protein